VTPNGLHWTPRSRLVYISDVIGAAAVRPNVKRDSAHMKRLLKTVIAVAVTNLLLVWGCYGLFNATVRPVAIWQMIGVAPGSPLTGWQVVLGCLLWVLSGPLYWISDPKSTLAFLGVSLLNSVLWGACLGLLIYEIRHRLQRHAA